MEPLEQSSIWRHLSSALRQLAPLADGRPHGPEEQRRAAEALDVIGTAIRALADQKQISRPEMRLLESEANRVRARLHMGEGAVPAGAVRPVIDPQASFDRLNRLLPVLGQAAEMGACCKPVLDCVRRGLELDLAVVGDERNLERIAEPMRPRVGTLVREIKRSLQTLSVMLEIQAAST